MQKKILTIFFLVFLTKNCPDDSFCLQCVQNEDKTTYKCLTCQYSIFQNDKNFCKPLEKEIKNCVIYKNEFPNQCLICERGFGVDSNSGNCIECKNKNCAICNEEQCLACFKSNLIFGNKCDESPNQCKKKNCEICDKDNICLKCKNGFALEGLICKKSLDFCLEGNKEFCTKCEYGYYVDMKRECKIYNKKIPQDFFTKLLVYVSTVFFIILISYLIYNCRNKQYESKIEKLIQ